MKWYYYILFFLAFACKNEVTVTEDDIGADVFYVRDSYKPFTGKCNVRIQQYEYRKGTIYI